MRCPRCGSDVRPSSKYPGYYLCDVCRKRYPASAVANTPFDNTQDLDYQLYSESRTPDPETARRPARRAASPERTAGRSSSGRSSSGRSSSGHSASSGRSSSGRSASSGRPTSGRRPSADSADTRSRKRPVPREEELRFPDEEPRKKSGAGKILLILLLLLLLAGAAFCGLVYFGVIDNPLAGIGPFAGEKAPADPSEENQTSDGEDPLSAIYHVGDTAEYNGISIQVIGFEESTGDDWAAPAEGNVFVFVNIAITNQNEEELPVEKMASFENYCGGEKLDYSANAFTALATNTDRRPMDGSIASGETLNGYLCLEVPADWTTLSVQYANNVWSNDKVTFEINK